METHFLYPPPCTWLETMCVFMFGSVEISEHNLQINHRTCRSGNRLTGEVICILACLSNSGVSACLMQPDFRIRVLAPNGRRARGSAKPAHTSGHRQMSKPGPGNIWRNPQQPGCGAQVLGSFLKTDILTGTGSECSHLQQTCSPVPCCRWLWLQSTSAAAPPPDGACSG